MLLAIVKKACLNRFLFTISIRGRLLLYFLFLILLPTCIISTTIYNKSTDIITKRIDSSLEKNLTMVEANILQKFEAIDEISTNIYLNHDLVRALSREHPNDKTEIINEMAALDKLLESYQVPSITQSILIPKLYILNRPEYLLYNFSDKVSDISLIEKEKWFMELPPQSKYEVVGLNKTNFSSLTLYTIKIAKRLFGVNDMHIPYAGLLTIDVGIDGFAGILNNFKPSVNSSIFIIDNKHSIIVSSDTSSLGKSLEGEKYIKSIPGKEGMPYGSYIEKINHTDMLVSYKKIGPVQWTILSLSPMSELKGELISFNRVMYLVIIICTVIAFSMALVLSDNISHPIRKLIKSMSVVQNGNFDISLEYRRNDEFAYLINSYKKMVNDIKDLIDKLYISEVNKKEAELKSLQAQINPHFLYNTLDSVNWLALKHNVPDISTMVTSLSDFFRYSLSKGRNIIPLSDEKMQVESYLAIQKVRFKDKLDYTIDFPQECMGYLTVKLILQPIVENAIIHGIEKRRGKGIINICAKQEGDHIELRISDNGVGANIDDLNTLLEGTGSPTKSYGIRNVNERIKQYFGNEFGIRFTQNEDAGVTVIIKFPALTTLEGFHGKDDYCG